MKSLPWLLCILSLAGCVAPPERQSTTAGIDIPSQWTAGDGSTNPIVRSWWESFGSDEIARVVEHALTNNFDLQAAVARVEAAAAESRIAGADLVPSVDTGFNTTRSKRNFIGFPIPGGGDSPLTSYTTTYGLDLSTAWELDLWGRVRSGKKAALANLQASQADLAALQQSLTAQTVKAWLSVVELRRQLQLTRQTVDNFERTTRQVERRYRRGLVSSLDFRLAMTDLENGRATFSNQEAQYERALRQLERLLGAYPSGLLETEVEFPALARDIPAGLPSELLERRPDLIAAERRLAASVARVREARTALYPRISLTASGGTSSDELSDLVNSDFSIWTLAANVAQPVFQGGRILAGIDLAKARNRQALAEYGNVLLQAFTEVETALAVDAKLADRERHLTAAVDQAEGSLQRAEERYAAGLESILTILQAQRNTFNAQGALIAIQRARLDNRVDLHLALGGGFPVSLNPEIPVPENDPEINLSQSK